MGKEGISVCSLNGMETAFPWGVHGEEGGRRCVFQEYHYRREMGGAISLSHGAFPFDILGIGGALFPLALHTRLPEWRVCLPEGKATV